MEDSRLEFDAEAVQNEGETYSSLTDINGVPVFTESFTGKVKRKQSEQEAQNRKLWDGIFVEPMGVKENSIDMLFMGTTQQIVKPEETANTTDNSLWYPLFGVWALVFLGVMVWYCQRRSHKIEEKKKEIEEKYFIGAEE